MGKGFFICFGGKKAKKKNSTSKGIPLSNSVAAAAPSINSNNVHFQQNGTSQTVQLPSPLLNATKPKDDPSSPTLRDGENRNTKKSKKVKTPAENSPAAPVVETPKSPKLTNQEKLMKELEICWNEPSQFSADWEKPEVIQLLLAHLPTSSLLPCRLVSKSWSKEASRLLRLNEHFTNTIPITKLREFTQIMSTSADNPMQSYQFHITSMRHPDVRYFFGQLGPTIVTLDLTLLISEAEAFFNILPWMPNLMELMLILCHNNNNSPCAAHGPGTRKAGQKPELVVKLVDTEIIQYIESTKTLIYCNYDLIIAQKESNIINAECKQLFSLSNKNMSVLPILEDDEEEEAEKL